MKYLIAILPLLLLLSVFSCEPKDEVITSDPNAVLEFSGDTILFDTVFVTQGSVTKRLKVYNPNSKAVRINEVALAGAGASAYELIINGVQSPLVTNVELRGKDSLLVLVKVNINPTTSNLPFLVADSILFRVNGNRQNVKLVSYGQDAYFHKKGSIGNTTWAADKPHVLLDTLEVREGSTLTILKGARIYARNKAALLVNGKLLSEGRPDARVVFSGYRREPEYAQAPGQWEGIRLLSESRNSCIRYTDIKNAVTGVQAANPGKAGTLIEGSTVQHAFKDGIASYGADVKMVNTLIYNCGQYGFGGLGGGNYEVLYSTIVNYNQRLFRETPAFAITDFRPGTNAPKQAATLRLVNSIIYSDKGLGQDEILLEGDVTAEVNNNLLRTEKYKTQFTQNGNKFNEDPKFKAPLKADFSLDTLSAASGLAISLYEVVKDLKGQQRSVDKPDAGAYERSID